MDRQCQLRVGPEILWEPQAVIVDLTVEPYRLVAGSWRDGGETLETGVLIQATTLSEVERYVGALRRMLALAEGYATAMHGEPLYVYHKLCDDLDVTAELGATWRRKRVHGGTVSVPDVSTFAAGHYVVTATLSLRVEAWWQRATVAPAVEGSSSVSPHTTYAGGLFSAGAAVTTRRRRWDENSGLTVRYHWQIANANCTFIDVDTDWKAWWDNSTKKFSMEDDDANVVTSSAYTTLTGLVDVVFVWEPGVRMAIYVNGHEDGARGDCVLTKPGGLAYTLFTPTGTQGLAQVQVWPTALTQTEIEGLYAWGAPEGELCIVQPPADGKNTNAAYTIYNVPGHGPAAVRLALGDSGAQDYAKATVALRPLRAPGTTMWECESETLGAATATNSNAAASGGSQARFTPADANYATRVTVGIAAQTSQVQALVGEHRLLLAGYDSAAAVQMNLVRWRLLIAGQAGDWSDDLALATVSQRSLLDMGTLTIPDGAWPEEALYANTDVYSASDYVQIEIQVKNTAGSGGGTLDLDAIYLFPVEQEGTALGTLDVSAVQMSLDFAGDPQATILTADEQQQEFAGWIEYDGDRLWLLPDVSASGAGLLRVFAYRDDDEEAYPNDTVDVLLFLRPSW